jgi:ferrochelatase
MASRLGLESRQFSVAFQSRLGREPWIQPFTDQVVRELPARGAKKLAVAMPAFTADCLETLEEIHIRAKRDFLQSGGTEFHPILCLNDDDSWVHGLCSLIEKSLAAPIMPCP